LKFLPTSDSERDQMLAAIGVASIDDLFASVPPAVRAKPRVSFCHLWAIR